jgi:hypothetical protein
VWYQGNSREIIQIHKFNFLLLSKQTRITSAARPALGQGTHSAQTVPRFSRDGYSEISLSPAPLVKGPIAPR